MKTLFSLLVALVALAFTACPATNTSTAGSATPAAVTGSGLKTVADLAADYEQAIQAYADYKAGNVDVAWTIAHVASAYSPFTRTIADVKQLVQDATGKTAGAQTLTQRIAAIFGNSGASGGANAAAIATAAQNVATKSP